jgi:hypothetical protein
MNQQHPECGGSACVYDLTIMNVYISEPQEGTECHRYGKELVTVCQKEISE